MSLGALQLQQMGVEYDPHKMRRMVDDIERWVRGANASVEQTDARVAALAERVLALEQDVVALQSRMYKQEIFGGLVDSGGGQTVGGTPVTITMEEGVASRSDFARVGDSLVAGQASVYLVSMNVRATSVSGGNDKIVDWWLEKNGAEVDNSRFESLHTRDGGDGGSSWAVLAVLEIGDALTLHAQQTQGGGSVSSIAGTNFSCFSIGSVILNPI